MKIGVNADGSPIEEMSKHPALEEAEALVKRQEALTRARTLIERQPCTTDMQIQVIKDLITIEELRRDWGV